MSFPNPRFARHIAQLLTLSLPENSQNPHHSDLAQSRLSGKGVHRAARARKVQELARQGPRTPTNEDAQGHNQENAVWRGLQDLGHVRDADPQTTDRLKRADRGRQADHN